jgi:serine/threonine-protein kinase
MSFQSLEPGRLVADKYRIRSWLGQGGMGTVYLVESVASGELLALKELALPHHPGAARQFRREVELLARLQHPALVQPRDFFEWGERLYFAMEYVDGCTLSQVIKAGPLPLDMALDCARQLCSVLECLHRQNPPILYRDLKPSNIMIDSQHRVRLIDFGIARCLEQGEETTTFLRGMGSAGYAPLEQYGEQGGTDERSDIYSLGATLYSVLTGKVPESPITRVSETGALTSLRLYNAKIPRLLDDELEERGPLSRRLSGLAGSGSGLRRAESAGPGNRIPPHRSTLPGRPFPFDGNEPALAGCPSVSDRPGGVAGHALLCLF